MKKTRMLPLVLLSMTLLAGCSKGGETYTPKSYTAEEADIQSVHIDVRDREIAVALSEDEQIHMDYYESDKEYYEISVSDDNMLTMTAASNKEWTDFIGGKAPAENRKISLRIPSALLSSLTLSTTNGDISISQPDLRLSDSLSLSANGGNITFSTLTVGSNLSLNVKNGNITGSVAGSYEDFAIDCQVKKGESNLPQSKENGSKTLSVSANNGDIDIEFVTIF